MQRENTAWMKCNVLKGMFSSEYLVVINDLDGNEYDAMFVDKTLVKVDHEKEPVRLEDSFPGRVLVHAGEKNEESNMVTVIFPQQPMNHSVYYHVPEDWLTAN